MLSRQQKVTLSSIAVLLISSLVLSSLAVPVSRAATSYNNVQVFLSSQAVEQGTTTYTLSVYNSTGYLVASSQGEYPAFSLELPSGTYLFAATVANSSSLYSYDYFATSQYGYQMTQISSAVTISIATKSINDISTQVIMVHAEFANGTAMAGASLYASVVGLEYWWPFASPYNSLSMSNQTNSNGDAYMTVLNVPLIVNAWNWVQVSLPTNDTTVQRVIGGQTINVTVYWQPSYVGLSGSALIVPPSSSASVTLYAEEQPNYWFNPGGPVQYGVAEMGGSVTTVSNAPVGVPSAIYNSQQIETQNKDGIAPLGSQDSTIGSQVNVPTQIPPIINESTSSNNPAMYATIAASIAAVACAGLMGFFVLRQRRIDKALPTR
jgi:hypothetical protein